MKAIEFVAQAKNGVIEIPKEYQEQLKEQFRVIILQEVSTPEKKKIEKEAINVKKIIKHEFTYDDLKHELVLDKKKEELLAD